MQSDRPRARDRREIDTFVRGALRIDLGRQFSEKLNKLLCKFLGCLPPRVLARALVPAYASTAQKSKLSRLRFVTVRSISLDRRVPDEASAKNLTDISSQGEPKLHPKEPSTLPRGVTAIGTRRVDYVRKSHSRNVRDFRSVITRCAYDIFNRRLLSCSPLCPSLSLSRALLLLSIEEGSIPPINAIAASDLSTFSRDTSIARLMIPP